MHRGIIARLALAGAIIVISAQTADAKRIFGIPVPKRGKAVDGVYTSRLSYRGTVRYYNRYLKARKIEHTAVPPYRYRGVLVARWISKDPKSKWLAIHVYAHHGKTQIFIVGRPQPAKKP